MMRLGAPGYPMLEDEAAASHDAVWRTLDQLARRCGMTPSGFAMELGLDNTCFNPSKRVKAGIRRWPTTRVVASAVCSAGVSWEEFGRMVDEALVRGPAQRARAAGV